MLLTQQEYPQESDQVDVFLLRVLRPQICPVVRQRYRAFSLSKQGTVEHLGKGHVRKDF